MNDAIARTLFAFLADEANPMPGRVANDWGYTFHWEALQITCTNAGNFRFKAPYPTYEHGQVETPEHMAQLLELVKESV